MPWLEELKIWFAGNARTNCGSWLSSTPRMTPAPGRTSVSRTICATRLLRCSQSVGGVREVQAQAAEAVLQHGAP